MTKDLERRTGRHSLKIGVPGVSQAPYPMAMETRTDTAAKDKARAKNKAARKARRHSR